MTALLLVSHAALLLIGVALGLLVKRYSWIRLGQRAAEQEHGWSSANYMSPAVPREAWSLRDRKGPAPVEAQPSRPVLHRP